MAKRVKVKLFGAQGQRSIEVTTRGGFLNGAELAMEMVEAERKADATPVQNPPPDTANPTPKLQGLGWMATRVDSGMFKDDRKRGHRTYYRGPIVAWLNCRDGQFSVNIVSKAFDLPRPIPAHITDLGEAVQWVYNNAVWR